MRVIPLDLISDQCTCEMLILSYLRISTGLLVDINLGYAKIAFHHAVLFAFAGYYFFAWEYRGTLSWF